MTRRRVVAILVVVIVLDVVYWVAWYADRSLVASNTRPAYYEFENAFPLADGWLAICCLGALLALRARSATALLWLLMAAGAAVYLFGMDVLYDLEHGIYATGAGGIIELGINLLTLGLSVWFLRWAWTRRTVILSWPG